APTEPRLVAPDQGAPPLATVRRQPDKDELELVRTHVPRGEAALWAARVDPKAFPRATAPELRVAPPIAPANVDASTPNHRLIAFGIACLVTLAGLLAFALRSKDGAIARASSSRSVIARPLLDMPLGVRSILYGVCSAAGLAALLWGTPLYGAGFVVAAM